MVDEWFVILLCVAVILSISYVYYTKSLDLFSKSLKIIFLPLTNFEALWFLLPVYFNWLLFEIFFEHEEKRFGRRFINGFTLIWISLGFIKYLIQSFVLSVNWIIKLIIVILTMIFGGHILVWALKGNKIIKHIGRTRELSFLIIFITPFFFDLLEFDVTYLLSGLILYVTFYLIFLILQRIVPEFGGEKADMEEKEIKSSIPRKIRNLF